LKSKSLRPPQSIEAELQKVACVAGLPGHIGDDA
jgi:hypothetical protein